MFEKATIQYTHNAGVEGITMQQTQANLLRLRCVLPCVDTRVIAAMLGIERQHVDGRWREHHEVPVVRVQPLENVL